MNKEGKHVLWFILRVIVYGLMFYGVTLVFLYDATHPTELDKFGEDSMTEILQAIILFILSSGYFYIASRKGKLSHLATLLGIFFLMSFIREFNTVVLWWFYLVLPLMIVLFYYFIRRFRKVVNSIGTFRKQFSSGIFIIGFWTTYLFSRLVGRTKFWELLLEGEFTKQAKVFTEEGLELIGYVILLISFLELILFEKEMVASAGDKND